MATYTVSRCSVEVLNHENGGKRESSSWSSACSAMICKMHLAYNRKEKNLEHTTSYLRPIEKNKLCSTECLQQPFSQCRTDVYSTCSTLYTVWLPVNLYMANIILTQPLTRNGSNNFICRFIGTLSNYENRREHAKYKWNSEII